MGDLFCWRHKAPPLREVEKLGVDVHREYLAGLCDEDREIFGGRVIHHRCVSHHPSCLTDSEDSVLVPRRWLLGIVWQMNVVDTVLLRAGAYVLKSRVVALGAKGYELDGESRAENTLPGEQPGPTGTPTGPEKIPCHTRLDSFFWFLISN